MLGEKWLVNSEGGHRVFVLRTVNDPEKHITALETEGNVVISHRTSDRSQKGKG